MLGELETRMHRGQLSEVTIERPIFICGLARSGSTMLLELLARQPGIATHQYRDFPLVTTPIWWNFFLNFAARSQRPQPRAHRDLIQISPHSPEGMEQILWDRYAGPANGGSRASAANIPASEDHLPPPFVRFYTEHIRKLLWLRGGTRYASKCNYHVNRIQLLLELFSDAHFVIPTRHPYGHVESLVRQHSQFCEYARHDRRVPIMLAAAGHYEFGPQRFACGLAKIAQDDVEACWARGDEIGGYAIMWTEQYREALELLENSQLSSQLHVINYEAFCEKPQTEWSRLRDRLHLPQVETAVDHVVPSRACRLTLEEKARIWEVTQAVAERLGYREVEVVR